MRRLKTIYCSFCHVSSSKVLHLHLHPASCCLIVSVFLSAYTKLKAMFRAASFDGQLALLVARHLFFLFFVIIVLLHLANKICSVQKNKIEAIQKRAIRIIHSCAIIAGLEDLDKRRDLYCLTISSYLFYHASTSCLHNLLSPPRDHELLSRLWVPSKYPRISNRTKKYQSFISYALAHHR